jgi:hypothetical protein
MVDGIILYQDGTWRTLEPDKIRAKVSELLAQAAPEGNRL